MPLRPIAAEARKLLLGNSWRGNVRELENTVHRAVLLAQGVEIGTEAMLTPGRRNARPGWWAATWRRAQRRRRRQ
jgi:transcriptional regulator with AAA-type ATPase domain